MIFFILLAQCFIIHPEEISLIILTFVNLYHKYMDNSNP